MPLDARHTETYLRAGLGDGTEVVDEVGLGHADTGIDDGENLVLLVGDDADIEVLAGVKDRGVGEGCIADLVERVGRVRDEFSEEDLLVGVEGVCKERVSYASRSNTKARLRTDDEVEKLADLSLEAEALGGHFA